MELRPAEPTDAMAVARVHVRAWQAAYRKLMPDDYLDQLRPEDRANKYDFGKLDPRKPQTIVATTDHTPDGRNCPESAWRFRPFGGQVRSVHLERRAEALRHPKVRSEDSHSSQHRA